MKACINYTDHDDREYIIEANVSRVVPARLYGPPEDCYPAEGGEVEDHEVREIDDKGKEKPLDYSEFLLRPGVKADEVDEELFESAMDDDSGYED
jgi:hypothetical protein